jgi:hypothetical protein
MQELPYNQWREYDPEDTVCFYALRLHELEHRSSMRSEHLYGPTPSPSMGGGFDLLVHRAHVCGAATGGGMSQQLLMVEDAALPVPPVVAP